VIRQADPKAGFRAHREAILAAIEAVLESGTYILGPQVAAFEAAFARYVGTTGAVGVANGTDALVLALQAAGVGPGDGVATVSHTATATVAAIELAGAVPLLVDVDAFHTLDPDRLALVLKRSPVPVKAVLPVHLYGQPAAMPEILALAQGAGAAVIEDASQAHGARLGDRAVGAFGALAAFSLYPTKNLGAFGDAGIVVGADSGLLEQVRLLRQYGWRQRHVADQPGRNSRLDELHAAVLQVLLPALDGDNDRRRAVARAYDRGLAGTPFQRPQVRPGAHHVYHQYVLRCRHRDALRQFLEQRRIATAVHYPLPVHRQPAYRRLAALTPDPLTATDALAGEILSLPMHGGLDDDQVAEVVAALQAAAAAGLG
jgi:dTDP-4-amino-4,6-dideoxygalactose transaminase